MYWPRPISLWPLTPAQGLAKAVVVLVVQTGSGRFSEFGERFDTRLLKSDNDSWPYALESGQSGSFFQ